MPFPRAYRCAGLFAPRSRLRAPAEIDEPRLSCRLSSAVGSGGARVRAREVRGTASEELRFHAGASPRERAHDDRKPANERVSM